MVDFNDPSIRDAFLRAENEWYRNASPEERLAGLVSELSYDYFADCRFEPGTICHEFLSCDGQPAPDPPDALAYFNENTLMSYRYKIEALPDPTPACTDIENRTLSVRPEYADAENGKSVILHELIHIYEVELAQQPSFLRDALLFSLYEYLRPIVPDLKSRIIAHANIYSGRDVYERGGEHGVLFLLKSYELDLRCGYKLGTVCAYGRDEHGEDGSDN